MPLPTVSRKVSELEAHLKTRLLARSSRHLALTDAGRSFFASCKRILEELGEAERTAAGEYSAPKGELVVAAPIVFGRLHALPIIREFLGAFLDIDVRLVLSDRVTNLFEEPVDVAIRIGALPDSSLLATRLGQARRAVCASPVYLEARGVPKRPADLRKHDCVTFEALSPPQAWTFETDDLATTVPIRSRLVVNTAEASLDAAIAGLGLTRVLSYQAAAAEKAGTLVRVLRSFEPKAAPISLVYRGQAPLPLKLRVFLDFVTPRLKERLEPHS